MDEDNKPITPMPNEEFMAPHLQRIVGAQVIYSLYDSYYRTTTMEKSHPPPLPKNEYKMQ